MRRYLRAWMVRLGGLFGRGDREAELAAELDSHLQLHIDDAVRRGMTPEDARRDALVRLGGMEQTKEAYRDQRNLPWLETTWQDLGYGARMLRRSPGFTAVAVLTLALGIGANTAIFSAIDAVLVRALPYHQADRLVMVWENVQLPQYQNSQNTPAPGNLADWKKHNTVFSGMAAIGYRSWNLTGAGEPVRIEGEAFSADIFSVLQVYPVLGRPFTNEEDRPSGGSRVALLGYSLWISRFGGNSGVIGRNILLDGEGYQVIGVMPPTFHFPDADDQLYVPLALTTEQLAEHDSHFLRVIARLKTGVSLAEAQSEMDVIAHQLMEQYPDSNTGVGVSLVALREQIVGNIRRPMVVLFGVVALILLMACGNVANLLFARGSVRAREFGVRSALGASQSRILRQLLAESLLLGVLGGATGLICAFWGMSVLRGYGTVNQMFTETRLDVRVCLFTVALSLLSTVIFGLAPALRSSRRDVADTLKEGAYQSAGQTQLGARGLLTVMEMALGVTVLIATGLLLRSFVNLRSVPLGFEPDNVLTLRVILRGQQYETLAQRTTFYQQALRRIGAIPGVRSVAGITFLPLTLQGRTIAISIEGQPPIAPSRLPFADFRCVSPGYFATMATPILTGRDFRWNDTPTSPLVAMISQTMARSFWPSGDAIGKRFKLGGFEQNVPWISVVGIVGDVRQLDLAKQPRPAMYFAATQDVGVGDTLRDWVIRTSGDPEAITSALRSAVWSLDPTLPISRVQTMEHVRSTYLGPQRFELSLVALFGALGLILAVVGLYGVTAYSVARRTNEIGIRVALGAQQQDVLRLVIGQGAKLAGAGIVAGIVIALLLTRVMSNMLFGVRATDPATFASVAFLLAVVSVVAGYIPARRAASVDPMVALRHE